MPANFIRHLGMVPSYYLRYYYAHDAAVAAQRGAVTRAEEGARLETELVALYADPAPDSKPPQPSQRGGAGDSGAAGDPPASAPREPPSRPGVHTAPAHTAALQ